MSNAPGGWKDQNATDEQFSVAIPGLPPKPAPAEPAEAGAPGEATTAIEVPDRTRVMPVDQPAAPPRAGAPDTTSPLVQPAPPISDSPFARRPESPASNPAAPGPQTPYAARPAWHPAAPAGSAGSVGSAGSPAGAAAPTGVAGPTGSYAGAAAGQYSSEPSGPYARTTTTPVAPAAPILAPSAATHVGRTPGSEGSAVYGIGAALLWMAVGFWVFVGVRMVKRLAVDGYDDTILFRTVSMVPEETVVVAGLAGLGAILLLSTARGRRGLGWFALLVAALSVGVAVWRYLP